jgi:predicted O-linked N-acetylglucosamine transferase (SPINDLY family)
MADAVPAFRKATSLRPDYADAWCNLGFAWQSLARPDDAVAAFTKALAVRPGLAGALGNLELALLAQGRHEEALESSRQPMTTTVQDAWAFSARLFALQNLAASTPAERTALAREYALRFAAPLRALSPAHANPPDPGRRLRIGYVSPNLNYHSVAFFLEPILAHHDKAAVEVFCYSDNARHDEVSERLRQHADHWCRSAGWPDQRLADRIGADEIDVLVDLAGHTLDNRLLVFARRPAPVQFTYLGYPATTGLDSIDYRLVTADTDPHGAEAWHSEALWRVPGSLWCYRPRAGSPPPSLDAPVSRLGYVTFGSSNNVAKLSPDALALWARILGAVPSSRLVMTGIPEGSVRDRLRQRFAAQGIDPARVTIHGRLPTPEFEALCQDIDIGLDPFPYNGTTTTCELLWLGVPVVTLAGETSVARSGVAILRALGLDELVAADADAYVALAIALAADLPRLTALRAGLRPRFEQSPLRDEAGLTRAIEAAYRTAWRAWCEGRAP